MRILSFLLFLLLSFGTAHSQIKAFDLPIGECFYGKKIKLTKCSSASVSIPRYEIFLEDPVTGETKQLVVLRELYYQLPDSILDHGGNVITTLNKREVELARNADKIYGTAFVFSSYKESQNVYFDFVVLAKEWESHDFITPRFSKKMGYVTNNGVKYFTTYPNPGPIKSKYNPADSIFIKP